MIDKKIIFLGTPDMSAYVLQGMVKAGFNIVGVITQEDKPRGRKKILSPSPVAIKGEELGLKVYKPHRLNKDFDFIKELEPDLLLTFAYGQIISTEVLSLSKYPPLNLHASILPKYRGAAPIQYALKNGDKETGVSLMEMVKEMDAGDVFACEKLDILKEDNYSSLCEKIQELSLNMAIKYLPLFFENKLERVCQDPFKVTFCPSIKKEEEHLDLNLSNEDFINVVRSLSFTPGGYLINTKDESIIKIYACSNYSSAIEGEVGQIIKASKKDLILQLKNGQIKIDLIQKPGKKMMSATDFNNGNRDFEGTILK
ncbi:MAG: methionyl-tRNA formyltransferase [Bacilli bacterium]|nr:methionyl-tRNA formyltransferase [Bacilli bacterium]